MRFVTISLGWCLLTAFVIFYPLPASSSTFSAQSPVQLPRFQNVHGYGNPDVTQENLSTTVCHSGYSGTVRPPTSYTNFIKTKLLHYFKLPGTISDYELDHLESISLGGSVYDTRNLWMQPWSQAHRDDGLEFKWYKQLCSGQFTLKQARQTELAYKQKAG